MTARKDFLDIVSLDRAEIIHLLDQAVPFKDLFTRSVKKVPALKGKTVLMLFYEPSTRTLSSFEVAAKRMRTPPSLEKLQNLWATGNP